MASSELISRAVDALIKKYGTRDPLKLCDGLGIVVKYKSLCPQIKAFFFYQSRIKTVVINSDIDGELQRILCAHELGHAVLHSELLVKSRGFGETKLFDTEIMTEYEANIFAAELLIDEDELLELMRSGEYSFFQLASILYVPAELLDFKLRALSAKGYEIDIPYIATANFLKNQ